MEAAPEVSTSGEAFSEAEVDFSAGWQETKSKAKAAVSSSFIDGGKAKGVIGEPQVARGAENGEAYLLPGLIAGIDCMSAGRSSGGNVSTFISTRLQKGHP